MTPSTAELLTLMRTMILIRRFEEKIMDEYPAQDMKTPVHLCLGQEAIAAGVCAHLHKADWLFTTHRGHGHCLAKGMSPFALFSELYGRATGCCRGMGGSMHPADPDLGIPCTSAIVSGGIPHAVGTALASRLRGDGRISATFLGDGAAEEGVFHESLNFAALRQLPVIFICENNGYAVSSPLHARQAQPHIHRHAASYDMPGVQINGNDVLAVHRATGAAVRRAKAGLGPTLIECLTYRTRGHVGPECDGEKGCRPLEEIQAWRLRCPLNRFRDFLETRQLLDPERYEMMVREIDRQLDHDLDAAKQSPWPDIQNMTQYVLSPQT